jgi:outer membrane protein assembly factor BamB
MDGHVDIVVFADPVDPALPPAPPPRPPRFREARIVIAGVLAVALVVAGLDVLRRHLDELAYPGGLPPIGQPLALTGGGDVDSVTSASIVDGRAFAAARSADGTVWVTGMDLTTGRPAWPALDLGRWFQLADIVALPQAVIVLVQSRADNGIVRSLIFIDPATGRRRWRLDLGGGGLVYPEVLVSAGDQTSPMVRGLDWRTGEPKWELSMPTGAQLAVVNVNYAEISPGVLTQLRLRTDHRLFEVDPDGTVTTYDARTGHQIDRRDKVLPEPADPDADPSYYGVLGSTLVAFGARRVDLYRLDDLTAKPLSFTPPASSTLTGLSECGDHRVCLQYQESFTAAATLQVVDTTSGQVIFDKSERVGSYLSVDGDQLLASGTQLYDRNTGNMLLDFPTSAAAFVAPGRVLMLVAGDGLIYPVAPPEVDVYTVAAATGKTTKLGTIQRLLNRCSADAYRLVCPTRDGLRAWRFALR